MPGSHGGLTKAGKVKKKTPYEEPKEVLKKDVVGRAKKRKQFAKNYCILIASPIEKKRMRYNDNSSKP